MTAVKLRTVVIGSGRSGTGWAARWLTEQGEPCGHESVFDWHPSSHPDRRLDYPGRTPSPHEPAADVVLEAESSLAAIAHLAHLPDGCWVWHLTRDPLAVVASWASSRILTRPAGTPYGRFVVAHCPDVAAEASDVARAARWVAEWNLRGHDAARRLGLRYHRSRLEDVAAGHALVNQHRPDGEPVTWRQVRAEATPYTAAMLTRWAHLAGYPTGDDR